MGTHLNRRFNLSRLEHATRQNLLHSTVDFCVCCPWHVLDTVRIQQKLSKVGYFLHGGVSPSLRVDERTLPFTSCMIIAASSLELVEAGCALSAGLDCTWPQLMLCHVTELTVFA